MFMVKWFWSALSYLGLYNKKGSIVFLGLDNAGKSTLLYVLKEDRVAYHEPTGHPQSEELSIGNIKIKAHDLGGHKAARQLWEKYLAAVDAVVFLVDVTAHERFPEVKKELAALLKEEGIAKKPFLVLGNKIDAKGAINEQQLREVLDLHHTTGKTTKKVPEGVQPIEVFMCSVIKRSGYPEGFRWLAEFL